MKINNNLPKYLASHSEYSLEITDLNRPNILISFIISKGGRMQTHNIIYHAYNGAVKIHLGSILKSIFTKSNDIFEYDETVEFTTSHDYLVADLRIGIGEGKAIDFKVINSALQSDDEFEFKEFEYFEKHKLQRLGEHDEMPRFSGYPMSTSLLTSKGIKRVLNSRGCPFDELSVGSSVNIKITAPNGKVTESKNIETIKIPNSKSANGIYTIEFITLGEDKLIRKVQVVNAGYNSGTLGLDILFKRGNEVLSQNEFDFKHQSYYDEITSSVEVTGNIQGEINWWISDPDGNTEHKKGEKIYWNPYNSSDSSNRYQPKNVGIYEVDCSVSINGNLHRDLVNFEVKSIEQPNQETNAFILITKETPYITTPEIAGDNITIRQLGGVPYKCSIANIIPEKPVKWSLKYPNGTIEEILSNDGICRLVSAKTNPHDFQINESGNFLLKAEFNYNGNKIELFRNLTIKYIAYLL